MTPLDRRDLLQGAAWGLAATLLSRPGAAEEQGSAQESARPGKIIDTNVSLQQWPFRRLPLDSPDALAEKLKSLGIAQAWAGSFEGLLHRDLAGVNSRLATACREHHGLLVPFGSVNVTLPDWEEDVRRCHAEHHMPGIRLHPNYHGYQLDDPRFDRLLALAAERNLLVQLAVSMEDRRTQHPLLQVPDVDLSPLPGLLDRFPNVRVLLLNYRPTRASLPSLAARPNVFFDIARVESTDGVPTLVRSLPTGRVVLGSHAPLLVYESVLIKVFESDLNETETVAVLGGNAKALLAAGKEVR